MDQDDRLDQLLWSLQDLALNDSDVKQELDDIMSTHQDAIEELYSSCHEKKTEPQKQSDGPLAVLSSVTNDPKAIEDQSSRKTQLASEHSYDKPKQLKQWLSQLEKQLPGNLLFDAVSGSSPKSVSWSLYALDKFSSMIQTSVSVFYQQFISRPEYFLASGGPGHTSLSFSLH